MTYTAKVSSKGQVTLPAKLRRKYGLTEGSTIRISEKDEVVTISADNYQERLESARAMAKKHMQKNGTWGMSWQEASEKSKQAKSKHLKNKYEG